jgi:hypothetical protein
MKANPLIANAIKRSFFIDLPGSVSFRSCLLLARDKTARLPLSQIRISAVGRFLDARYSHVAPRGIASSIQIRDGFSKLVELPLSSKER